MLAGALLNEVEELRKICIRLDGMGEQHPLITDQLLVICGHIRASASLLEVLVTLKIGIPPQIG